MKHFEHFPKIEYSNNVTTNVLVRAKIRELILQNNVVYYEYRLDDYERADILAQKYYGSTDNTWILYYANEIVDPQFDWLLSYEEFKKYMLAKYQGIDPKDAHKSLGNITHVSTAGTDLVYTERFTPVKAGDQIIAPNGQVRNVVVQLNRTDVTLDLPFNNDLVDVTCSVRTNIHSYYNSSGLQIDYNTWKNTPVNERNQKTFYDFENEANESKRYIRVIDKKYYRQLINEFERIF